MARASQVVLSENEYYLIKAPNGKVLEVKDCCGTTPGTRGSSGGLWTLAKGAGGFRTGSPAR